MGRKAAYDILKVNDRIIHKKSRIKGTITNVNSVWGWYEVTYDDNTKKTYNYSVRPHDRIIMLLPDDKKKQITNNQD